MSNKKAYSNPNIEWIDIDTADVLVSSDPSVSDDSWADDIIGGGN